MSIIKSLYKENLLNLEQEYAKDICYEGISGSFSYGINTDTSDIDVISICIPPVDIVFPHLNGYIQGFGTRPQNFEIFQQHHIQNKEKEYDVAIYSIVKFFDLAADNNPNICDMLFLPDRCITYIDNAGKIMRQNRKLFLHKGSFHRFIGYAYSQNKKMKTMNVKESRKELFEKYGYDTKYASHLVRLCLECKQVLAEHDLDLERNSDILKSIRAGEWTMDQVERWFKTEEENLNRLYIDSSLRVKPDYEEIKRVLLCCLEEKYGSLSNIINSSIDGRILRKYEQIKQIIES